MNVGGTEQKEHLEFPVSSLVNICEDESVR